MNKLIPSLIEPKSSMDIDVLNEDEINSSTKIPKKYKLLIKKINTQLSQIDSLQKKLNAGSKSDISTKNNMNKRKRDIKDDIYVPPTKSSNKQVPTNNTLSIRSRRSSNNSTVVESSNLQMDARKKRSPKSLSPSTIRALDLCSQILQDIKKHEFSDPFLKPVDPIALMIPDYFDIIKEPMDLSTVSNNLQSGYYESIDEFIYDMRLIWDNAMKYNQPDSGIYNMAKSLSEIFEENIKKAIAISQKSSEDLKQEMLKRIEELKSSIKEYEQKIQEIRNQIPDNAAPIIEIKKLGLNSRNNRPVPYEEKIQLSNQVNNMEPKYYSGIISIIEQDMPNILNTDEEVLELDIDELEPSVLWRIADFIKTYIFEANIIVDIDNSSIDTIEQPAYIEVVDQNEDYSSSNDSDSESSDSDSSSEEDDYELNRDFTPFNANVERVEIQNADSWSKLNFEDEKVDIDSDIEVDVGGSTKEENIDPLWQEFKNKGMQNQLRAQQEEKLKYERELKEKKELERIKDEEEKRLQKEKELEEVRKRQRDDEIKRRREEERRKRENATAEIDILSQHAMMKSFESNS